MIVYKTTNLINGKIYIGMSNGKNKKYLGSGIYLKYAINKYGKENFIKEILEDNIKDKKILCKREKYWIEFYNSKNSEVGYNLTDGGEGLINPSNETKQKLSNSKIGKNNPNFGKFLSKEIRQKMSVAKSGSGNSMFGISLNGSANGMYGKHHSEQTKHKMRKARSEIGKQNMRDGWKKRKEKLMRENNEK